MLSKKVIISEVKQFIRPISRIPKLAAAVALEKQKCQNKSDTKEDGNIKASNDINSRTKNMKSPEKNEKSP